MSRLKLLLSDRAVQGGAAALLLLSAGAAYSMRRAVEIETIDTTPAATSFTSVAMDAPSMHAAPDIRGAVQVDPFQETRTAPAKKYLLPWEVVEDPGPQRAGPPRQLPVPTMLSPGKDSASAYGYFLPRQGGGTPVEVRIGGKIGDWTLVKIDFPYRAFFVSSSGERIETKFSNPR